MVNVEEEMSTKVDFRWVDICDGGNKLIDDILTGTISDLDGRMIILPTERMVQDAKLRIAKNGGGFTSSIITPRKLPRYLYDLLKGTKPLIDLTTREMLIQQIMKKEKFNSLVGKGDVRVGMVQNISRTIGELISEDVSFLKLQRIARTGRSRELCLIYQRYMDILREREMVDPDLLPKEILNLLHETDMTFDVIAIYLPGDMNKLQREMIHELGLNTQHFRIREHASRRLPAFLDIDDIPDRPHFEPSIPLPGEKAISMLDMKNPVSSLIGMDELDEIRKIFRHLKERCIRDDIAPSSFRIVFPVRQAFDDLVKIASEEYEIPVDQGEDLPLERAPIINSLLSLFRSAGEGLKRKRIIETLSSPFLKLRDDDGEHISGPDIEMVTRAALMGPVRRRAKDWFSTLDQLSKDPGIDEEIKRTAQRMLGPLPELLIRLEILNGSKGTAGQLIGQMMEILSYLDVNKNLSDIVSEGEDISRSKPGEGPFQFNVTSLHRFYIALRSIERRTRIIGASGLGFAELLKNIEIEISKETIRSSPRVSGIQIMGLAEAVGLEMTNTYFASVVEGSLPFIENGFRILTEGEKKDVGMDQMDPRRKQLENLAIAMGSTSDLVVCYRLNTGDRPVSISSFIENIELSPIVMSDDPRSRSELYRAIGDLLDPSSGLYHKDRNSVTYSIPDLLFHAGEDAERLERGLRSYRHRKDPDSNEYTGRIVDEDLISMIRDRYDHDHTWSVTQFETFRKCPYLFFVRYILGIRELEDLEPGIPPEKKGLIFHEVVENFYNEFRRKHAERVTGENLPSAIKLIRSVAVDVIAQHPNKGPYWDALKDQMIGNGEEKGLLECFLEIEAEYGGPFVVEGTEIKFGLKDGIAPSVRISLPGDEEAADSFKLKGSIDRLDILRSRDGDLDFIWDYKTGSSDVDKESVQVPLYLAAIRKLFPEHYPAGGGYYYVRRRGSITRSPVDGDEIWNGEVKDKEGLQSHITAIGENIHDTIQRCLEMRDVIRSGDLSPQAKCKDRYCKFPHLCRRGDI